MYSNSVTSLRKKSIGPAVPRGRRQHETDTALERHPRRTLPKSQKTQPCTSPM